MGPNGSGKTTLFELITGSQPPDLRQVRCAGQDIHRVPLPASATGWPSTITSPIRSGTFAQDRADASCWSAPARDYPLVHLFDEPQFNTQDGYIGFMLDFFRRLARRGPAGLPLRAPERALPPRILREICERFIFVRGRARCAVPASYDGDCSRTCDVRAYLGELASHHQTLRADSMTE